MEGVDLPPFPDVALNPDDAQCRIKGSASILKHLNPAVLLSD